MSTNDENKITRINLNTTLDPFLWMYLKNLSVSLSRVRHMVNLNDLLEQGMIYVLEQNFSHLPEQTQRDFREYMNERKAIISNKNKK